MTVPVSSASSPPSPAVVSGLGPVREAPPTGVVPQFAPLRGRRGRYGRWWPARHRLRVVGGALAVTAAALLMTGSGGAEGGGGGGGDGGAAGVVGRPGARSGVGAGAVRRPEDALVRTPVRIAEPAALRLLHPGSRVDVIAARARGGPGQASRARVVAARARVVEVPEQDVSSGPGADTRLGATGAGAVIVLAVPRGTAVALAGAAAEAALAVVVC